MAPQLADKDLMDRMVSYDKRKDVYQALEAADAWKRALSFFQYLQR